VLYQADRLQSSAANEGRDFSGVVMNRQTPACKAGTARAVPAPVPQTKVFRDTQWQHVAPCVQRRRSADLPANRPDCAPTVPARGFPRSTGYSLRVACSCQLSYIETDAVESCAMRHWTKLKPRRALPAHSFRSSPAKHSPGLDFCPFEREGIRQAGSAPHSARHSMTLLAIDNSPSRRGDSNPGPLHYE
jgi:hypothetical protein